MSTRARLAVLPPRSDSFEIMELMLPDPGPFEVLVEQYASGVCHSQLHEVAAPRKYPVLLGHEATGVVSEVGTAVTHVRPGDDVIVTWIPRNAAAGRRAADKTYVDLGDGSRASIRPVFTWGTHALVDERFVVGMPDGLPQIAGSVLGCAIMSGAGAVRNTVAVGSGDSVAVWGVGGVGLAALAACRAAGAAMVIAVDIDEAKLHLARRFGATHLVDAGQTDPVTAIRDLTPGDRGEDPGGADYVVECIGSPTTIAQAVAATRGGWPAERGGGTTVLIGAPTQAAPLDLYPLLTGEKRLVGSLGGSSVPSRDFPLYADLITSGALDLDALVTSRGRLEDVNEILGELRGGRINGRAVLDFT